MTPLEIIAKKMISRSSHDGEIACGHRLGESDATAIIMALGSGGYHVVSKTLILQAAGQLTGHGPCADDLSQQLVECAR